MITDRMSCAFVVDHHPPREISGSQTLARTVAIAIFTVVSFFGSAATASAEPSIKDFPLAIVCARGGVFKVGYLDYFLKDGSAVYLSQDGRRSLKLTAEGKIELPAGLAEGVDCVGKTIQELRAEGRAVGVLK